MAGTPFIGPSHALASKPTSVQRTVNLMPVPIEPGNERTGWVFKDVPGLVALTQSYAPAPPPPDPPFTPYTSTVTLNAITNASPTNPQVGIAITGLVSGGVYSVKQLDSTKAWQQNVGLNSFRNDFFICDPVATVFTGGLWCRHPTLITYANAADAVAAFPTNITITGSTGYLFAIDDTPANDNLGQLVITVTRIA